MKTPVDVVKGRITDIRPNGTVLIEARYDDIHTLLKRNYKECYIEMVDSRPISYQQRKACWAMIGAIAEWQGQSRSETAKEMVNYARKVDFLINEIGENAERLFSLSNAPMSLICAYERYLARFIVENDIPTSFSMLGFVDDVADYVYACLINRKCVICGQRADLHHVDRVGMGRNRNEIVHEGMEALPLCRIHHEETHTMTDAEFFHKYHLDGGVKLDKTLCRIYKLKENKQ